MKEEIKKDIKNYLHLYLGCEVMVNDLYEPNPVIMEAINDQSIFIDSGCDYPFEDVKPILRLLPDMTEDEEKEYAAWNTTSTHESTRYLLSKGFDIFGLIEAGLAIDRTAIKIV